MLLKVFQKDDDIIQLARFSRF